MPTVAISAQSYSAACLAECVLRGAQRNCFGHRVIDVIEFISDIGPDQSPCKTHVTSA